MAVFIMAESGLMVNASIDDDFMADGRIAGWFWIQLFQLEVSCVTVSRLIPNSHALRLYPAIGYIILSAQGRTTISPKHLFWRRFAVPETGQTRADCRINIPSHLRDFEFRTSGNTYFSPFTPLQSPGAGLT